jgi:hypothetical protein
MKIETVHFDFHGVFPHTPLKIDHRKFEFHGTHGGFGDLRLQSHARLKQGALGHAQWNLGVSDAASAAKHSWVPVCAAMTTITQKRATQQKSPGRPGL